LLWLLLLRVFAAKVLVLGQVVVMEGRSCGGLRVAALTVDAGLGFVG
jgi:hypothetical protein